MGFGGGVVGGLVGGGQFHLAADSGGSTELVYVLGAAHTDAHKKTEKHKSRVRL